jgi:DNA repair protein RadC
MPDSLLLLLFAGEDKTMKSYFIKGEVRVSAKSESEAMRLGRKRIINSLSVREQDSRFAASEVFRSCRNMRKDKKESFVIFCLDTRGHLIKKEIVSVGILNASLVHPREVFEVAIRNSSSCIVIAHNHPSGDVEPSDEDLSVTTRLEAAGKILGIELFDHVIVGSTGYCSMREQHLL